MALYKHQQELIDLSPDRHLLSWGTGTGKTAATIGLVESKSVESCIVICPKSLVDNWDREIKKFTQKKNIEWFVISKEQFKKHAPDLPKYKAMIWDEAHYVANYKSQLSKATLKYLKKHDVQYRYLLTATPFLSSAFNLYTLALILGYRWNYMKFKRYFFNDVRMGVRIIPVAKPNMEGEVAKLVQRLGSAVSLASCIDLPKSIYLTETFELTKEQEQAIDDLVDFLPIVRFTKIHQIAGGTCDGGVYKSEKLNRCLDIIKENKKIAIVCRYNAEIDLIRSKISKRQVYVIQGKTPDKQTVVDSINRCDDCVVLLNAACSEGYNLHTVPVM